MDRPFQVVEDWLRSLGLLHYAQSFYDNGYEDIETVKQIDIEDLNAIDIKSDRDRQDILCGVKSLRDNIYFELETAPSVKPFERKKLEPLLLKSKLKDALTEQNIQLTEPPYFNVDGTLGDLYPLAIRFADELETIFDDVLEALETLRKRQLPIPSYDAITEISEPLEYLDCELPQKFRTHSLAQKNDTRITKSTTDLSKDFINRVKDDKDDTTKKTEKLKSSIFGNAFKKRPIQISKSVKGDHNRFSACDFNANDVVISQSEIIDMWDKVKNKEISQEELIENLKKTSKHKDNGGSPQSTPGTSRKNIAKSESAECSRKIKNERSSLRKAESATFYASGKDDEVQDVVSEELNPDDERKTVESDLSASSKCSPETAKSGFFRGIRNSLRKKGRSQDESPTRAESPVGTLKDDSNRCRSNRGSLSESKSSSSGSEIISNERKGSSSSLQCYDIHRRSNMQIDSKAFSLSEEKENIPDIDSIDIDIVENLEHLSQLPDELEKKAAPIPPPRDPRTITKENNEKTIDLGKPIIPPRKNKVISPIIPKNIEDIDKEMQQLLFGLSDELKELSQSQEVVNFNSKKPLLPPKRTKQKTNTQNVVTGEIRESSVSSTLNENNTVSNQTEHAPMNHSKFSDSQDSAKKVFKCLPLKTLISKKMKIEEIEINQPPYTNYEGIWEVPSQLIIRYAEELCHPLEDIENTFEILRAERCSEKRSPYVKADFSKIKLQKDEPTIFTSLDDWLISIGLPMFIGDFKAAEITSIEQLQHLNLDDFLQIGIFDKSHRKLLMEKNKQYLNTINNR